MAGFGNNTLGGDEFPASEDRALMDLFACIESGTTSGIWVASGPSSTGGANWKGLVYSDVASLPASRLAVGASVAIAAANTFYFSAAVFAVSAQNYWVGMVADSFEAYYSEHASGTGVDVQMANGSLSFASPPASWPGSDASYPTGLDCWVEYTPAGSTISLLLPVGRSRIPPGVLFQL